MAGLDPKELAVALTLQVSILCTVFGFGLKLGAEDLLYLARNPGLFVRSLVAMFVVMPIVAVALVQLFDFRRVVEIALVAISISPVPPLLPRRETSAGGRESYDMSLMAALAFASIVIVPLAIHVLQRFFGRPLVITAGDVARVATISVLAPLAAGMVTRRLAPRTARPMERVVSRVGLALLTISGLVLLADTASAIWALVGNGTVVAFTVFVLAGLAVGHALGGPDPRDRAVLALSSACRHPAMAVSIAAANFPDERFGAAIILYSLLNVVVCLPYVAWQKRRLPRAA